MFCPRCGSDGQLPESYCKRCGEWLPNIDASGIGIGIMRNKSPEQKVQRMRILELISAGLSITSFALIVLFLSGRADRGLLNLAALCAILVTFYQILNFYLGYTVERRKRRSLHATSEPVPPSIADRHAPELNPADTAPFSDVQSVTENTTRHLDPQLRDRERR